MAVTPSGKDKLLRWARLYIGGYDLSGDLREFGELMNSYEPADMTGVSETARNYLAGGSRELGVTGIQVLMNDTASTGSHTLLNTPPNTSQLSIAMGGGGIPAVGDPSYHVPSRQISDSASFTGGGSIMTADVWPDEVQYTANYDGGFGVTLRGPTSLAATLTGASANSIDFGAASAAGWSAVLQVTATSSGNFAMKIRHSTDDSSFSDLGTFTSTGGAIASELLSGSGAVNRYVAFDATRTAGTITVIITFVRN